MQLQKHNKLPEPLLKLKHKYEIKLCLVCFYSVTGYEGKM